MLLLVLTDDAALGILHEVDDVLDFGSDFHVLADFLDAFLQHALRIEQAIGLVDALDGLVAESAAAKAYQVDAREADGLLAGNHVGRNVLTGAAAALEHDVSAHAAELVEQAGGRDDGKVVDNHLAGKLRGVADDAAVANHAVVTDVHVLHQQVVAAHDGLSLRGRAAADGHILTDGVVVANLGRGVLALELQVLGLWWQWRHRGKSRCSSPGGCRS